MSNKTLKTAVPQKMSKLEKEFWQFHKDNPHIWLLFRQFARKAMASGRKTYSSNAIFERVRWWTDIDTNDVDGFKINNNHRAYYTRLFQATYPNQAHFFRTRSVRRD